MMDSTKFYGKSKHYSMNKNYNNKNIRCNNCGNLGHFSKNCNKPITSYGIILIDIACDTKDSIYDSLNIPYKYDTNKTESVHSVYSTNKNKQELFCKSKDLIRFLMISRKHSIGYMEFLRGRYKINDIDGIQSLFKQMLPDEIKKISTLDFASLWDDMWSNTSREIEKAKENANKISSENTLEQKISTEPLSELCDSDKPLALREPLNKFCDLREPLALNKSCDLREPLALNKSCDLREQDKLVEQDTNVSPKISEMQKEDNTPKKQYHYDFLMAQKKFEKIKNAKNMVGIFPLDWYIKKTKTLYVVNEWGFPKGRKNYKETNLECASREFCEETGLLETDFKILDNIVPIEEIFTGTDGIIYKYVYYVGILTNPNIHFNVQKLINQGEVGDIGWFNFDEAYRSIRQYHVSRLHILTNLHLHLLNVLMGSNVLIDVVIK